MEIAMIGGRIVALEDLDEVYRDRGMFFGDGVYEVLRSYDGYLFGLEEHLARFHRSLQAVEIEGIDISLIRRRVLEAFDASEIENAKIYFHITRGAGPREHCGEGLEPRFFLTVSEAGDSSSEKQGGISVITTRDIRWKRCDIKTLNLLPNVLAARQAAREGCQEAIFFDDSGLITEGTSSAFFAIFGQTLRTTPLSGNILPSITRKFVLRAHKNLGFPIVEESVPLSAAPKAEEMFIAVSSKDIVPIVSFDGQKVGDGRPGKITQMLMEEFSNIISAEISKAARQNDV